MCQKMVVVATMLIRRVPSPAGGISAVVRCGDHGRQNGKVKVRTHVGSVGEASPAAHFGPVGIRSRKEPRGNRGHLHHAAQQLALTGSYAGHY